MAYNAQQQLERTANTAQKFLGEYRVKARVTEQYVASYDTPSYSRSPFDKYRDEYTTQVRHCQVVELTLTENDLERLIDDVEGYKILRARYGDNIVNYLNEAYNHAIQLDDERKIRNQNPGVQLAWDKYQMMLKIAGGE